ncbi:MAG: DNA translocase FtsK, partial [Erysipelotrichaceae bacterium]|nr:DNA translocase FtsK [Erysipelotrichaceae bacterium]
MANQKRKKKKAQSFDQEIFLYIYAIIMISVSLIGIMRSGFLGELLANLMMFLFGTYYAVIFCILLIAGVWIIFRKQLPTFSSKRLLGVVFALLALVLWTSIPKSGLIGKEAFESFMKNGLVILKGGQALAQGGLVGACFYFLTSSLVDITGTYIIIIALFLLAILLLIDRDYLSNLWSRIQSFIKMPFTSKQKEKKEKIEKKEKMEPELITLPITEPELHFIHLNQKEQQASFVMEEPSVPIEEESVEEIAQTEEDSTKQKVETQRYDDYTNYRLPSIARMLEKSVLTRSRNNEVAARNKGKQLIDILAQFSISAQLIDTYIGPSVTKFVIKPDVGVKVNKILNLQDNIKMELAAKDIRIEAPIPGRNGVGVEIPNVETTVVSMREIMESIPADKKNKKLLVALGKDLLGNPVYCELDRMPHLLIAGSTGSGKSVCMNSIICSLLLRTTPAELKLLLIDPKKVEFTQYHQVPHLIGPVITDSKDAARALEVICTRMDQRYDTFSKVGVRKISEYNEYVKKHPEESLKAMPFIVVIIDELADLMNVAGKEVEMYIQRITQLARAAGIHLVVATQRPSTDVITGIIKTNIPSRIAFAVSSGIDSRTILDQIGAERLLGNGDMLYVPLGEPSPMRVQGVYVTDKEVENITKYVSEQ